MIVMEVLKAKWNGDGLFNLYFYRDSNGNEVDLVVETGERTFLTEIKMSKTLRTEFAAVFERLDAPLKNAPGLVVSFAEQKTALSRRCRSLPWWSFIDSLESMLKA